MNVLLSIYSLEKARGGPMMAVCQQSESLARHGLGVSVMTVQSGAEGPDHRPRPELVDVTVVPALCFRRLRLALPIGFTRRLRQHCRTKKIDLIHNHGLWTPMNHLTARVANELGIPLVWTIHGMLSSWSLRHKRWKKIPAWWLYQRRDLQRPQAFIATAPLEAEAIRAAGAKQPIAVIPDGVEVPAWQEPRNGDATHKVLFLGRIYPVKGLMNLVRAWAQVRPPGWECVIAGPDHSGHQAELQAEINALKLQRTFRFPGPVEGDTKWELYRSADVLVLPSFTENFGKVVPEALSCGIPVIATKAAPWECLVSNNCGWWIDVGVEPLARTLVEATGATDAERQAMGKRGRELVEVRFSCERVALEIKDVYDWVLGGGPKPPCVTTR